MRRLPLIAAVLAVLIVGGVVYLAVWPSTTQAAELVVRAEDGTAFRASAIRDVVVSLTPDQRVVEIGFAPTVEDEAAFAAFLRSQKGQLVEVSLNGVVLGRVEVHSFRGGPMWMNTRGLPPADGDRLLESLDT